MDMAELSVTAKGKTVTVRPTAADMVAWEKYARANKLPMSQEQAQDFPRITHVAFLAYNAGLRAGLWNGTANFTDWLDSFEGIEAQEGAAEDNPL